MNRCEWNEQRIPAAWPADDVMNLHYCKRGLPLATSFLGPDEELEYLRGAVDVLKWEINDVFNALDDARREVSLWRDVAAQQAEKLERLEDCRDHQRGAIARLRTEKLANNRPSI